MTQCLWIACTLCLTICSLEAAQPATNTSRISGIKYVAPLNGLGGSSAKDEDKYECYRCNRYKGGGAACPETQRQRGVVLEDAPPGNMIVRNCEVCLKVKTVMFFRNKHYIADKVRINKNAGKHFESKEVISRACVEDKKDARLVDGCITDVSVGGTIERCYCQGNHCNTSPSSTSSILLVAVTGLLSMLFTTYQRI